MFSRRPSIAKPAFPALAWVPRLRCGPLSDTPGVARRIPDLRDFRHSTGTVMRTADPCSSRHEERYRSRVAGLYRLSIQVDADFRKHFDSDPSDEALVRL